MTRARTIRTLGVLACFAAGNARSAHAQTARDSAVDSSWQHAGPAVAAWTSVGFGRSSDDYLAGVGRVTISVGPLLVGYRASDTRPLFGHDGVRDDAMLAGIRSGGHRLFASAALGYAHSWTYHECASCRVSATESSAGVLAYDVALHANYIVPGVALALSGTAGPSPFSLAAVTIGVELGWFGR